VVGKAFGLIGAAGVAAMLVTPAGAQTDRLSLVNGGQVAPFATPDGSGFEDRLAREIYRRLGIEIEISWAPSARALMLMNEGREDGSLARNPGMSERFPNLVQYSEHALTREYVVFAKRGDIEPDGWHSLRPYDVGIVNGWKILERNITGTRSMTKADDGEHLFRLLADDRVDLVVFNRWGGLHLVKDLGLTDVEIIGPPLAKRDVYFYLHKKHADLAVKASETLREMKRDGTYRQIFEETLAPLQAP
jgi:polar amino acid transport system substrate-binding protein